MAKQRVCKDCPPAKKPRPIAGPGPRCATHHRAAIKARKEKNHDAHVVRTYGLTKGQYKQLYEIQGGRCYICRKATGKTKRLPVDHNHKTGKVRGLLCGICNQYLGWLEDNPDAWLRGFTYLVDPPADRLGQNDGERSGSHFLSPMCRV